MRRVRECVCVSECVSVCGCAVCVSVYLWLYQERAKEVIIAMI